MVITAMTILERCRTAERELRLLGERANRYRDALQRMTSTLDGVGARATGEGDRMAAMVAETDALEHRTDARREEYAAELAAAQRLLDRLPEVECKIMERYYIRRQPLKAIAMELGYSYGYARICKGAARDKLERIPADAIERLLPAWYTAEKT